MKDRIASGIFSLSGASLAIAAAGFLSAVVTMFIDVADTAFARGSLGLWMTLQHR